MSFERFTKQDLEEEAALSPAFAISLDFTDDSLEQNNINNNNHNHNKNNNNNNENQHGVTQTLPAELPKDEEGFMALLTPRLREAYQLFERHQRWESQDQLQCPTFMFIPNIKCQPWHDADPQFFQTHYAKTVQLLEARASVIQQEMKQVLQLADGWDQIKASVEGTWRSFYLYREGIRLEANCKAAPTTVQTVEDLPLLLAECGLGYVYFSVVKPGTHILPHFGPSNLRVRIHLGLDIPASPECFIEVAHEKRFWQNGKCLVFDDSYIHRVYNYSSQDRIILLIDIFHPELTSYERQLIKKGLPPPNEDTL